MAFAARVGRIGRGVSGGNLVLVVAAVASATACADYDSYGGLQPGSSGGSIQEGNGGAAQGSSGSGGRSSDAGPRDSAAGAGGETAADAQGAAPDARDGSDASRGNVHDAAADSREGAAPPDGGNDVRVHDATLDGVTDTRPIPDASRTTLLTFDSRDDYMSFRFLTPTPIVTGPGVWAWAAPPLSYMVVTKSATAGDPINNPSGTFAIYQPGGAFRSFADVRVSVRIRSDSPNSVGMVVRYVDETHYYRFWVAESGWDLYRGDGDTMTYLDCGGGCIYSTYPYVFDHAPGHKFTVEARGNRIRAWIDDELWADVVDSTYPTGEIGLYDRGNQLAEFDDFEVEPL